MNLRQFLCSLPAALFCPKALALPKPVLVPPRRLFPWHDGLSPIGLWVQAFDYDKKEWGEPHLVLAEFNEDTDNPYQGMQLNNSWRNKFWMRGLHSQERILAILEHWEMGVRFFKNEPNTDWGCVYPSPKNETL